MVSSLRIAALLLCGLTGCEPTVDTTKDAGAPEVQWWQSFPQRCAESSLSVAPERLAPNPPPEATDEGLEVEWIVEGFCASNGFGLPDQLVDENFGGYGADSASIRIGMVADDSAFVGAAGVAVFNSGGRELRCDTTDTNDLGFAQPPLRVLAEQQSFVTASTPALGEEDPPPGATIDLAQRRFAPDHRGCSRGWNAPPQGRWTAHAVTGDGQHVAVYDRERLFSVRIDDCLPLWTAAAESFWEDAPGAVRFQSLFTPTAEHLFAVVESESQVKLVGIDSCGKPTSSGTPRTFEIGAGIGGVHRLASGWLVSDTERSAGGLTGHATWFRGDDLTGGSALQIDCAFPAQIGVKEFACIHQKPNRPGSTVELRFFEVPSGEQTRAVRLVQTDEPGTEVDVAKFVVALQGAVVVGVKLLSESTAGTGIPLKVFFVEEDGDVQDIVLDESPPITDRGPATPMAFPTGQVVFAAHGQLYSLRTPYPGLATTTYPRGSLGGNDNLGYARLSDE